HRRYRAVPPAGNRRSSGYASSSAHRRDASMAAGPAAPAPASRRRRLALRRRTAHPEALDGEQLAGAAPSPIGRERPPLREQPFVRDGVAEAPERSPAVDRPQQRLAQPGLL